MPTSPTKSHSTSDVHLIGKGMKTPPGFSASAIKRKRSEDNLDYEDFKEEIRSMMHTLMEKHETEGKAVSLAVKEIRQSITNIESSMNLLSAQNEDLKKKLDILDIERKKDRDYITVLEDKLEDMQRQNRKTCIEVKNIPSSKNETKEDLLRITNELSKTVNCPDFSNNSIKDIYRIKRKDQNKNTIVVELTSTMTKTDLLSACKSYNNKNKNAKLCLKHVGITENGESPIYISEQLTPKAARLYFLARDLSKTQAYKFCWTSFGKVYVRKDEKSPSIHIANEAHVHKLSCNSV